VPGFDDAIGAPNRSSLVTDAARLRHCARAAAAADPHTDARTNGPTRTRAPQPDRDEARPTENRDLAEPDESQTDLTRASSVGYADPPLCVRRPTTSMHGCRTRANAAAHAYAPEPHARA
jgi:hypothetical protein